MITYPIYRLKIIVCDNYIAIVCTGSVEGPLRLALLFMCIALDHKSL